MGTVLETNEMLSYTDTPLSRPDISRTTKHIHSAMNNSYQPIPLSSRAHTRSQNYRVKAINSILLGILLASIFLNALRYDSIHSRVQSLFSCQSPGRFVEASSLDLNHQTEPPTYRSSRLNYAARPSGDAVCSVPDIPCPCNDTCKFFADPVLIPDRLPVMAQVRITTMPIPTACWNVL